MQTRPNNPVADLAGRTLVQRAAELGLWVWCWHDGALSRQAPREADPAMLARLRARSADIAGQVRALTSSDRPIRLADGAEAAFIADPADPASGFVVTPGSAATARDGRPPLDLATARRVLSWTLQDLNDAGQQEDALADLTDQLSQCYENIAMLYDIGRAMRNIDQPRIMAQSICAQLRESQNYGWSAIRMAPAQQGVPGMDDACLVAGELPCARAAFHDLTGQMLARWDDRAWSKLLQVGNHPLAGLVGSEVMIEPIRLDGAVIGVVMAGGKAGSRAQAEATSGDTQLLDAIAGFLGALHENATRLTEQKNMFIGSLKAVSAALDAKDRYTHGHSERVAWLGAQLAKAIGLSDQTVERIRISGLVHDVGKIGVPEATLCKTGRLTDREFDQIKKHPRIGHNILKGIPKMQDVLDGVLYHHERWDGRGYPTKLAGEDIPLYGRILAVADTFDAMSSTRSYRQAMPRDKVLAEIRRCAGSQFDPALTDPFVALDFTEYDAMVKRHQGIDPRHQTAERAA